MPDLKIKRSGLLASALSSMLVLSLAGCASPPAPRSAADADDGYYEDRDPGGRTPETAGRTSADPAPEERGEGQLVLVRRAPSSDGPLDGDLAGRRIFGATDELDACYRSAGGASAGMGVAFVVLDVTPQGDVESVLIGYSDIRDARFLACLERTLEALEMPSSDGESVIQAHLVFGAADRDQGRALMRAYRAARDADESDEAVPLTEIGRQVQGCYERVFRGRRGEPGRLVLGLGFGVGGSIESVEILEDDFDGRLDECVRVTVNKLRILRDDDTADRVTYPVVLQPGRADEASGSQGPPHPHRALRARLDLP